MYGCSAAGVQPINQLVVTKSGLLGGVFCVSLMVMADHFTLPRVYIVALSEDTAVVPLGPEITHYLKNVLRRQPGDQIRVFNGKAGEFLATIRDLGRADGVVELGVRLRPAEGGSAARMVVMPPLKKEPLDWAIEKAVELGVTDIHFILTDQADVRAVNIDRLTAHAVAAATQCERLNPPMLYAPRAITTLLADWSPTIPLYAAVERGDYPFLATAARAHASDQGIGVIIGPAGGWSVREKEILAAHASVTPVSLGQNILRAETAVLAMLSYFMMEGEDK